MGTKGNYLRGLFERLNEKYNYAVLRDYQELPHNFSSHDIDILIDKKEFFRLKHDINSLNQEYEYKVLMVNENERFVTFIIAKLIGSKLEFIYLDFFFDYSLYGVCFIEGSEVLERKIYNGKVYHVTLVDEFLEKYLNTKFLNQPHPEKYSYLFEEVKKSYSKQLNTILGNIFNDGMIDEHKCSTISGRKLLYKVLMSNLFRRPLKQISGSIKFIYFYLKGWLTPNGFSLSMSGPDGSGKTTILTVIETQLSHIYREVKLQHFRPNVIPRIAELFKRLGYKKIVDENYSRPHRGGNTNRMTSWLRLFYYITDYVIGFGISVKPVLFRRGIVIFDRYFTDIASDSKRSRINLNYKTIFSFRQFVPSTNYNFIIFVEPELILTRKQELTREQIDGIYEKLNYICDKDKNYTRVTNNESPDVAINTILDFILENQDKKYSSFFQ